MMERRADIRKELFRLAYRGWLLKGKDEVEAWHRAQADRFSAMLDVEHFANLRPSAERKD